MVGWQSPDWECMERWLEMRGAFMTAEVKEGEDTAQRVPEDGDLA